MQAIPRRFFAYRWDNLEKLLKNRFHRTRIRKYRECPSLFPFANVLHDEDAYFAVALIYCPYKHAAKIQKIFITTYKSTLFDPYSPQNDLRKI